jgi:hypothetical protein
MGHLLNSGEVGNIGLEHLKQIRSKTISKWNKLGFLEGLKGHVKENIAQLYENQASSFRLIHQVHSRQWYSQLYEEYSLNYWLTISYRYKR